MFPEFIVVRWAVFVRWGAFLELFLKRTEEADKLVLFFGDPSWVSTKIARIFAVDGSCGTAHPGIRKSRISWYQNRLKDFSS